MSAQPREHMCLINGCRGDVAPSELMCEEHFALLPAALRASLTATYQPGQEVDGASAEHLAYVAAAVAEVAHKQARQQRRKPRAPAKPVQLALFEVREGAKPQRATRYE
ncbi:hypothetical protein [Mycobacterium avium]|uniref:hypothetical protein n=1 Tax=Mycobacterium avium TaxID=1764 RepID=UPI001CC5A02F|nr:hypothetical protein [Mycobacterium avium]MBZ4518299.1 hypothetical protein [Mycobacterium avium subsp. hominissuis]MBZ4528142.1 hypothetical protein [Mycobacterium avium subsp. hominissuis]MBZ4547353.1 hypothetical protein [Mycobacterium avium subsp. hominissuis]MBZ4557078.1 hypothetical protein [Mycobacterium avium subsp. hominissuis]MBZ4566733.1 hypothetical protein [Mycobacterium avium subsp. hominissuis]